jgi:hypothetical protein
MLERIHKGRGVTWHLPQCDPALPRCVSSLRCEEDAGIEQCEGGTEYSRMRFELCSLLARQLVLESKHALRNVRRISMT